MSAAVEQLAAALAAVIAEALQHVAPPPATAPLPPADYTVAQLAERFGRETVTIRSWLAAGRFDGAYKLNQKEWRIPASAVLGFEVAARTVVAPVIAASPASLAAWRRNRTMTRRAAKQTRTRVP